MDIEKYRDSKVDSNRYKILLTTERTRKLNLLPVFYLMYSKHNGWFRFFGKWGIAWKNMDWMPLLFSERNGYVKKLIIGNYSFKLLK